MSDSINRLSSSELVCSAFKLLEGDPDTLLGAVDRILIAATKVKELSFTPTSENQLLVGIAGSEAFNVNLPHLSLFRSMLARIGTICDSAAKKSSLVGKGQAFLARTGVVADKTLTEQQDQEIEYVRASIRDQPGSPLYKLDAQLNIRLARRDEKTLHLEMENSPQKLSLVIRS